MANIFEKVNHFVVAFFKIASLCIAILRLGVMGCSPDKTYLQATDSIHRHGLVYFLFRDGIIGQTGAMPTF